MKLQVLVHYFSLYVRGNLTFVIIFLPSNKASPGSTTTHHPSLQASEQLFN